MGKPVRLVRYCNLCGRRVRTTLDIINRLRDHNRLLVCHVCCRRAKLGHLPDDLLDS